MVIIKASKDSEAGVMPKQKGLEDMLKFNKELVKAGVVRAGDGLEPRLSDIPGVESRGWVCHDKLQPDCGG